MSGFIDAISGAFSREKTRSARATPLIIRMYSGRRRVMEDKKWVVVAASRTRLVIAPKGESITFPRWPFDDPVTITGITVSFDAPGIRSFESPLTLTETVELHKGNVLHLEAAPGEVGLATLTNDLWGGE